MQCILTSRPGRVGATHPELGLEEWECVGTDAVGGLLGMDKAAPFVSQQK